MDQTQNQFSAGSLLSCFLSVFRRRTNYNKMPRLEISEPDLADFDCRPLISSTPISAVPDVNFFSLCSMSRISPPEGVRMDYSWEDLDYISYYDRMATPPNESLRKWRLWNDLVKGMKTEQRDEGDTLRLQLDWS